MPRSRRAKAAALCLLAAGLALGVGLGSERWGGLVPCALCLLERWPYRIAMGLAAVALVVPPRARWAMLYLVLLAVLVAAGLAVIHVGVEQGFWPSPLPECAAPPLVGTTLAERLSHLPTLPSKPCDEPTYLIPGLPLSMAAMNLLYALAFAGLLAKYLARPRRMRR